MNRWHALSIVAVVVTMSGSAKAQQQFNECNTGNYCVEVAQNGTGAAVTGVNWTNGFGVYGESLSGYGVRAVSDGANGIALYASATGGGYGIYATADGTTFGADAINAEVNNSNASAVAGLNFAQSGNAVGVYGQSGGSYAIYANGNLAYTASLLHVSDARFKKNVASLEGTNPLDRVLRLRGVTYEWKEPEKHGNRTGTQYGFIAQEVEKEFPTWVHTDDDGFKMLSTEGVEPMLLEGIRVLKARNDLLEDRIKALESNRPTLNAGFGVGGGALGFAGLALGACALVISRRRRPE
jgi:hypothetical protein